MVIYGVALLSSCLLAGMLALGVAMQKTGVSTMLAGGLIDRVGVYGIGHI